MKSNSLKFDGLVITRDDAPLSQPISMTLDAGDLLVVKGNNGSGKSTLLKTIAGLLPVKHGAITIRDHWPSAHPILYLGHKRGLVTSMTVLDNVVFWANSMGQPELTAIALHYFDLEDIAGVRLGSLSAGWQQRVALTRLITIPAPIWLLDEPTANLDSDGMALLYSLMQTRIEQSGIIVMTAHSDVQGERIKTLNLSEIVEVPEVLH